PSNWKAPKSLNALIAGSSLALGPTGMALMMGTFGPSKAQDMMGDLMQVGSESAIKAAKMGGMVSADLTGRQLKLTAAGINGLADMIRNPEKFGQAMKNLGLGVQQFQQNTIAALGQAVEFGGEMADLAKEKLGQVGGWLADQGQQGYETLKWMANPENWDTMGAAAKQGISDMISRGGELADQALEGLKSMGTRGLEIGHQVIGDLQKAGVKGLEMLDHTYRKFAEDPNKAMRDLGNAAIDGIQNLAAKGGELGRQAVNNLIDFVNEQPEKAVRAMAALGDLAKQGGEAVQEMAKAWGKNLSEGGKAFLDSLENLGDAGTEALGKLALAGGQMANQAATRMVNLAQRGVQSARQGLATLGKTLSPANLRAMTLHMGSAAASYLLSGLNPQQMAQMFEGLNQTAAKQLAGVVGDQNMKLIVAAGGAGAAVARGVCNHAKDVVKSYENGVVAPWDPRAKWWIGPNPFARGGLLDW
ncbi:MAG: hypothetical protein KC910_19150, partial [Candidatus Eremiobacteraeota bacterium]|nr:hypothetical protein [Candidatus Eremiobacteraeota bacterium]